MPRLRDTIKADRRNTILDAAQQCFAQSGFHGASMQAICAAAAMSPGNLYRYFASKEALIEGICQRDLDEVAFGFAQLSGADNLMEAFAALGRNHMIEREIWEIALWLEARIEASRNPHLEKTVSAARTFIRTSFINVVESAIARGVAAPKLPVSTIADTMLTISDGIMVRRISDPDFDAKDQLTLFTSLLGGLLDGVLPFDQPLSSVALEPTP